jgi:phage terminase large subunit
MPSFPKEGKTAMAKKRKGIPLKDRISYRDKAPLSNPTDNQLVYRYLNTFVPLPWQLDAMRDQSEIVLFTGSQGGGKSRTAAEKIHAYCLEYPGAQALVLRKVRDNVVRSSMRTEKKVVGDDPRVNFFRRDLRADYLNGSNIYFAGMHTEEQREAIRSIGEGSIDIIWMEEAHEFEEDDYEELLGRLRGSVAHWNQLILTTNPDSPIHWINRRLILGEEAVVHYSAARDNPYNAKNYDNKLDKMTGTKRDRLRDGLWVMASGMIIDTWVDNWALKDRDRGVGNVTEEADYVDGLPVWIFADDGYAGKYDQKSKMYTAESHPRVFLLAQMRSDGQLAVFAESYSVHTQKKEHLKMVDKMCKRNGWPKPVMGVFDSAAPSLGGAMRLHGISRMYPATKNLDDSVDVLIEAVAADRNEWRGIIVHPRCRLLRFEMATWSFTKNGRYSQTFDNGPDALRYGKYHFHDPDGGEMDMDTTEGEDESLNELMDRIDKQWEESFEGEGLYF